MTKPKTSLSLVQPDLDQMEAVVREAAQQTAPITSRAVKASNENELKAKALHREREEYLDRVKLLDAQYQAAKDGLAMHLADIDDALAYCPVRPAQ